MKGDLSIELFKITAEKLRPLPPFNPLVNYETTSIVALLNAYYFTDEKIERILVHQQIELKPNSLVRCLPNVEVEAQCVYCESNLNAKLPSRASKASWQPDLVCSQCQHIIYQAKEKTCACENCQLADEKKTFAFKSLFRRK
ncbi:hypothetical protein [Brochothrix campestris]|uniref:Uncharacterized protein n=1 Tax=Brochothrix campestris FSL F6-1037 TaxID=1265861 RepID=W7CR49_9LIST|nr:hypothetical protein [Brochothrix campestris]EUJ42114.1 hypothetical protein BCAMP_00750 [Brochothrix campestris FSL F6-1037]